MGSQARRLLLVLALSLTSAALLGAPALAAPKYVDPPTYKAKTKAPATTPRTPPAIPLGNGTFPDELVDEAGTAHIVWNDGRGDDSDAAMYCRLKRGATTCDNNGGQPLPLTWNKDYGSGDGPQYNIDNRGPKIVRLGNQLLVFSERYPTIGHKPDGDSSSTVVVWSSTDGGQHWTDAQIVGKWNIDHLLAYDNGNERSVLALGQDPFCGGLSGMCLTNFQSGAYQPKSTDLAVAKDQAYNAALAPDALGRPVAAFNDLNGTAIVRRFGGSGDVADPGTTWTGAQQIPKAADVRLAGGPAGLFMMSSQSILGSNYELRKLDGVNNAAAPGPTSSLNTGDATLPTLSEDPAGRIMAAWVSTKTDDTGVKLATSRPLSGTAALTPNVPSVDPAETLFPGTAAGQLALGAAKDGGGFLVGNATGGINSVGPIFATAFGRQGPTGAPGLGDLPGGFGQTNSSGKVGFGAINIETEGGGAFFLGQGKDASNYVTRGAIDLYGLKIVPDAGVKLVIDPKKLTIDAVEGSAQVKVIVSSPLTGDIVLWHGSFHRDLSKLVPGSELFSFDSSQFAADILGFDPAKNISVRLNKKGDGLEIPLSLKLPGGFGGAAADATFTVSHDGGLDIGSLHLHIGPVSIGVATLNNFDLTYMGADQLWEGDGSITFAGFGTIGAKASFHMGNFHEAHVTFAPAVPPAIGPFVFLTRADIGFGVDPLFVELGGQVGLGAAVDGKSPVTVDGSARLTIPDTGPARFHGEGRLAAALITVATAQANFQTDGYADFKANVDKDLTIIHVKANMEGFVDAGSGQWGADLDGTDCLPLDIGCIGAEAAASNAGLAICGKLFGGTAGIRMTWKEVSDTGESIISTLAIPLVGEVNAARLVINALAIPCNTKGFKVPPPRAASAQAGGGPVVTVPRGLPTETIAVFGDNSGAPQVDLTGPGGERIAGPAAGQTLASSGAGRSIIVPKANVTMFVINSPKAGNWTVVPRAGSSKIIGTEVSDGYRPATAKATIGGKGRSRTLSYRISNLGNDQSVEFIERGRFGTRLIGAPKRASGHFAIAPTQLPGGARRVYAQVKHAGVVTSRTLVARYVALGPAKPGRVSKLKAKRSGRVVTVSWRAASSSAGYLVKLSGPGTSQVRLLSRSARSVRFTEIAQPIRVTVEVRALGKLRQRGAARRVVSRGTTR